MSSIFISTFIGFKEVVNLIYKLIAFHVQSVHVAYFQLIIVIQNNDLTVKGVYCLQMIRCLVSICLLNVKMTVGCSGMLITIF